MNKLLVFKSFVFSSLLIGQAKAQDWTYMKGTALGGQFGVYGTQGMAAAANMPGSRSYMNTWSDNSGNLWLFGGGGWGASLQSVAGLSDLWRYSISANQWTWVAGPSAPDQPGVYGTMGVPAAGNNPGGRQEAFSWRDNSGNLWLYGGYGAASTAGGFLNDLWKFDIATGLWTWVHGSNIATNAPVYGTQGVAAAANTPGSRMNGATWTDANGDLWLFGGSTFTSFFGDLWKYTIATNQWTWMHGTNLVSSQAGVYGTQGIAAAANRPGTRSLPSTWTDNNGNLWLFGGAGQGSSPAQGSLNDLWKYNVSTNEWTWMHGANTASATAIYGTQGVPAAANTPGARSEASTGWKDNSGNLWLFGGQGYATTGTIGKLSDVWKYNIATNEWTWVKGPNTLNQLGVYGTQGVTAASNIAGARVSMGSWTDNAGNLWVFGGHGHHATNVGYLNDLWKFQTCTNIPFAPVNNSLPANLSICSGASTTLTANSSTFPISWFPTATSTVVAGTGNNFTIAAMPVGSYTYYAQAIGCQPSVNRTAISFTVNPLPAISASGGSVCAGSVFTMVPTGAATYTYSSGSATVMPASTTSYSITGKSAEGCLSTNTAVVQVSVVALPVVSVNGGSVCAGQSFVLSPTGASAYIYSGGSATVMPASTSMYTITGTDQGCTSLPAVSTVTVYALPGVSVTSTNAMLCSGSVATLSAIGASSYNWSTGAGSASISVNPSVSTHYTLTGTSNEGCVASIVFTQSVTICTGLDMNNAALDLRIYPNPSHGAFSIESGKTISLQLIDELGRIIQQIECSPGIHDVNLKELAPGIYFITGISENKAVRQKIVVSK